MPLFFLNVDRDRATLTFLSTTHHGGQGLQDSSVLQALPITLKSLDLHVGPGLHLAANHIALLSILGGIMARCPTLSHFSITSPPSSWSTTVAVLVLNWPPSILRIMRIADPTRDSEISLTLRMQGNLVNPTWAARLSPDRFSDVTFTMLLWNFNRLTITSPGDQLGPRQTRDTVEALLAFLPNLRDLLRLSLPIDYPLLHIVSALPLCNNLTLTSSNIDLFSLSRNIDAVATGLRGFDHLRKLCLPSNALFPSVHHCLGTLQGLEEIKVLVTSRFPTHLTEPGPPEYPKLQTLKVVGSFRDLEQALRAFTHPEANQMRRVGVECWSNEVDKGAMANAFNVLIHHCPSLTRLSIHVGLRGDYDACEKLEWADLSPLARLRLKTFKFQHPKTKVHIT